MYRLDTQFSEMFTTRKEDRHANRDRVLSPWMFAVPRTSLREERDSGTKLGISGDTVILLR